MKQKVSMEDVKKFAYEQMDAMWHDQTGFGTENMVKFTHKGYTVVNPWMDERTQRTVKPYQYYGKQKVAQFVRRARKHINQYSH